MEAGDDAPSSDDGAEDGEDDGDEDGRKSVVPTIWQQTQDSMEDSPAKNDKENDASLSHSQVNPTLAHGAPPNLSAHQLSQPQQLQYETSEARYARLQSWARYEQEQRFRVLPRNHSNFVAQAPPVQLPPVRVPGLPLPVNVMAGVAGVVPSNVGPTPPKKKPPPPAATTKKPAAKKKKKDESVYCKTKFTLTEVDDLMGIIDQILPVGMVQWEMVETEFNMAYPTRMRTTDNLRRQFNKNVKKKVPTGNPNIPKYVREAKRIQQEIIAKAQAVHVGGEDDTDNELELDEIAGVAEESNNDTTVAKAGPKGAVKATPRARNTAATRQDAANREFLEVYLAGQKVREEQQRERDRMERKQLRRMERLERQQQRKSDKRLKMVLGVAATAFTAYLSTTGGSENPNPIAQALPKMMEKFLADDSSSDDGDSSSDESDTSAAGNKYQQRHNKYQQRFADRLRAKNKRDAAATKKRKAAERKEEAAKKTINIESSSDSSSDSGDESGDNNGGNDTAIV